MSNLVVQVVDPNSATPTVVDVDADGVEATPMKPG